MPDKIPARTSAESPSLEQCRSLLRQIEKKHAAGLKKRHGLICRELPFGSDSAVLYMAKEHWTNRFSPEREKTVGIFFSLWVSEKLLERDRFAYNIHSLKLRQLPGHKLASRQFATEFRQRVSRQVKDWPNIGLDHGPLTLLQGHDNFTLEDFPLRVHERIEAFVTVHAHLDELLEAGRV